MTKTLIEELRADVCELLGQKCWAVVAGTGTGALDVLIGKKIPNRMPLRNPRLSADLRDYDSEMGLFIECSWRLDSNTEVLCAWTDDNQDGGPVLTGLNKIIGQTVSAVNLKPPGLDLEVQFDNSLTLRVFCDRRNIEQDTGNYVLFLRKWIYAVRVLGEVEREPNNVSAIEQ
jgi:hypothetical protein